jgi:hypothetical protein
MRSVGFACVALICLCVCRFGARAAPRDSATTAPATAPAEFALEAHVGEALPPGTNECPREKNGPAYYDYGTAVSLTVVRAAGDLLAIDPERSKLAKVTDEHDTNIGETREKRMPAHWPADWSFGPGLENHLSTKVSFWFPKVPPEASRQLRANGVVTIVCGSDPATTDFIDVAPPASGGRSSRSTPVAFGPYHGDFRAFPPDTGDVQMQMDLYFQQDVNTVRSIEYFDERGRPVRVTTSPSVGGTSTEGKIIEIHYSLKLALPLPQKLRGKITYYRRIELITAPFDVSTSLPPFPAGPMAARLESGPWGLTLEIEYDRVALKDAGLSPDEVNQQVKVFFDDADSVPLDQLRAIEIRRPKGERHFLGSLVKSFEVRLKRAKPPL